MIWVAGIAAGLVAYLLGSIPTGYLLGRAVKGIDIRQHGSGGTGATNVLRTVGKRAALAVLLIDLFKGAMAVLVAKVVFLGLSETAFVAGSPPTPSIGGLSWVITLAGLMAIVGHSRSIWINFTGGKSAASGLGVLLALSWPIGLGAVAVFAAVLLSSRIVSLGSIAAALSAAGLMVILQQPLPFQLLAIAGGCYVIIRHRSNIERMLAGTEPRLGTKPTHSN